ncbi:hypothetical protein K491DRAFT_34542 [Lophiostoma macrostomum CBS 122681]|uniref:Mitotic checkpoint regulator, MAD2B-interacting-domain-containing protein n=1 Tax=Lophiostoma macrostomum CBS 122681 TaxID=1314788 RepID=A0A6A6T0A7_9PLEO|nr:hypothetical protein K491DRAFT_34542 [Lophiostoma macrostomum CBS 122681]
MNLIAYSDSEESDNDAPQAPKPAAKPVLKPSFHKVVDRSQPGKIKLSLPSASQPKAAKDDIDSDAPPAKKARTGGGAFSGFNAMLPAPKKPNVSTTAAGATSTETTSGTRGPGKALGKGVNLKTGAEPAFRRESNFDEEYDEHGNPIKKEEVKPKSKEDFRALLNLPAPKTESKQAEQRGVAPSEEPIAVSEVKPEAKPAAKPRFMPLSVARGKKKKPAAPRSAVPALNPATTSTPALVVPTAEPQPVRKPKVSLFSVSHEEDTTMTKGASNGDYQPLLYGTAEEEDAPVPDEAFDEPTAYRTTTQVTTSGGSKSVPGPHGLSDIASELNLTEAQRRQLFGRKGQGPDLSAVNIIEFNTDTEYAHNEQLRQQGETVQHNHLKSISGTGKNSLRSLINVASTQKDALEEHFASGRRNKREAGSKYGW